MARTSRSLLRVLGVLGGLVALLASTPFASLRPEEAAAATTGYTIVDLGVLPGLPGSSFTGFSSAQAINNSGVVVGFSTTVPPGCGEVSDRGQNSGHAFRWTPETGMQDLGGLVPAGGQCQSTARGINDAGFIVGWSPFGGPPHAALWSPGSLSPSDLGTAPLGACAFAVNPTGDIVVGTIGCMDSGPSGVGGDAFIWRRGQGLQQFGIRFSFHAINSSGTIACSVGEATGAVHACLLTPDGTIKNLPDLPGSGTCEAFAVNDNNEAVGFCAPPDGVPDTAMRWDSAGNAHSLGATGDSVAFSINSNGDVVGSDESGGFLWTRTKGLVHLSTLLPPGSGWTLVNASAINDQGRIVGDGLHNGLSRAFIMTPPVVRFVYLIPSDRAFRVDFESAIDQASKNIQSWYGQQQPNMAGKTFRRDPVVHVFSTFNPADWYGTNANGPDFRQWFVLNVLADGFALTGGMIEDTANLWVFYIDSEPKCEPGPGGRGEQIGGGGTNGVAILWSNDLRGLAGQQNDTHPCGAGYQPDNRPVSGWIGGLGHELGHAFGLCHGPCVGIDANGKAPCDDGYTGSTICTDDMRASLMVAGFYNWPDTYLMPDDQTVLISNRFFY